MPDLLSVAQDYIRHGLSVFPVEPGGKRPDFRHIESQDPYWSRFATHDELENWYGNPEGQGGGSPHRIPGRAGMRSLDNDADKAKDGGRTGVLSLPNIGIACGDISGNLFCLDFDDGDWYRWWIQENPWTMRKTRVAKTPKGHHVYLRCSDRPVPSTTVQGHVDLKGVGGYVVAPPSYNAERKASYSWLNPAITEIGEVDSTFVDRMWKAMLTAFGWEEMQQRINQRSAITSVVHEGEGRNSRATQLAGSWLRQFGADGVSVLEWWNQRCCQPPLTDHELGLVIQHVSRYVNTEATYGRAGSLVEQMQEVVE